MLFHRIWARLVAAPKNMGELSSVAGERRVLVAGLGNYGMGRSKHSVGMAAVQHLAHKLNVADQWKSDGQCQANIAMATFGHVHLVLLKPRMLMNINGRSVAKAAKKFGLGPEDIYLLHDELDKPFGKVSLKLGGSARGHNGVRSCIASLNSDCMVRLRIGIGRPASRTSVERYVLEAFSSTEREVLPPVLEQGAQLVLKHIVKTTELDREDMALGTTPSS